MAKGTRAQAKELTPAARDYTMNLHKICHKVQFKKKAPRALREIKRFAAKNMQTPDVKIDVDVNQYVWSKGVRNIPRRVRIRCVRKKNEDDESGNNFYTLVKLVRVASFKNLVTENSRD